MYVVVTTVLTNDSDSAYSVFRLVAFVVVSTISTSIANAIPAKLNRLTACRLSAQLIALCASCPTSTEMMTS